MESAFFTGILRAGICSPASERAFNEAADITGIILTKLDSSAKGGIVISIANELKVPVKLVSVGEKIDDLQPFSAHDFVEALFENDD